ncbi:MAG: DNA polymerase I [Microthrixaceae bacterium]|nr:DNA polymerase I [Microthrixaceae bacterium]
MPTLMLIDGNSLTYRAFHALPTDLSTASGQVTNAVYGFTSMLINLVRDHKPDLIAVTFDRPEPTFRHERIDTYKANRSAAPDILRQQMGLVREVVEALALPVVEVSGFEADDVIATLATQARDEGISTIIVTGDRDSYQLVEDPYISVLYNKRGVSDYALYDEAGIVERTGVRPDQYVIYAALRGDPSDNLPGIPGVGEKTAAKLVTTYGTLDGIFAHAAEQTPKLRSNLEEHEAQARTNAEVMVLVRDVPLEVGPGGLEQGHVDRDELTKLFNFLEFGSLVGRLSDAFGARLEGLEADARDVIEAEVTTFDLAGGASLLRELANASSTTPVAVAGAWSGVPGNSALVGLAVVADADAAEVAWMPAEVVAGCVGELGCLSIVAHDSKPVLRSLLAVAGDPVEQPTLVLDTKLAAYLLDPADARYELGELLERYVNTELAVGDAAPDGQLDFGAEDGGESIAQVTARAALGVARLAPKLREALDAQGLSELNDDVETPLVSVLARMEHVGVGIDVAELRRLSERLVEECERLRALVVADAGEEFNVNSTKQLREILFERLGLTPQKRTKTGYSTDAASLEKLLGRHPIIEHLLAYREVEKLRSTYGEGLLAEVQPDGRIHATFNQTVARTGRLSSDAPNLHNIPVRSEEGRQFRRVFVPAEGYELLVADYNQIELRCIAHLAEDPGLIESFSSGRDIHNETAARVFGVGPAEVSFEQRSKAKMVSYGLAYGMEAYGLGRRLNIPTEDAQVILDAYFDAFPAVRSYMQRTVAEARERGYTETLFGRRRQIPELSSSNFRIRQAGERQAMNAGIQGLAADIFKVALVRIDRSLREGGLRSRLILQVHDEVLLEVPPVEHDAADALVRHEMGDAFDLAVPLEVNLAFGSTWADAKA